MKVLSLFSGAGGLDLGFEQQGFIPVLAYDAKSSAVDTYNFNRPENSIAKVVNLNSPDMIETLCQDIDSLDEENMPKGIVGGPPCQYFSNGNKSPRNEDDPRRHLPRKYAEILKYLNQKYGIEFFIFENVDGLAQPKHKEDFDKILTLFESAGFYIEHQILDAYNFGVPQHRKRVFIIGWNKRFYPKDSYKFPQGEPSQLTVRHAIDGLEEPKYFERNLNPLEFPEHPNHWTMQPRSEKFKNPAPDGIKKSTRSFRRLDWDEPSYTVAYGHNEIHIHPNSHRRLSIYEAMLLQGFPKGKRTYRLMGALSEQVSLVSDAVPPPLASALALSIKNFRDEYRYET